MSKNIGEILQNYNGQISLLAQAVGLITKKNLIAQIRCDFDYEMNGYYKGIEQFHFFTGQFGLKGITNKIFAAKLIDLFFVNHDLESSERFISIYNAIEQEHGYKPTVDDVLSESLVYDEFNHLGDMHPDIEAFITLNSEMNHSSPHFKRFKFTGFDNLESSVRFQGTLYGDSHAINIVESNLAFAQMELECSLIGLPFYKDILLDAYQHMQESNYKMCAFLSFAAFESFVNIISRKEDESGRLADKFKTVFREKEVDGKQLNSYDSFTKLIKFYESENLAEVRNSIAHGKEDHDIWIEDEGIELANKLFAFTALVILTYEQSFKKLADFDKFMKDQALSFSTL